MTEKENSTKIADIQEDSMSNILHMDNMSKDTLGPVSKISMSEQLKLDSLKKYEYNKYAQTLLKQFAYCNCLYEAFKDDSNFVKKDHSNRLMAIGMAEHPIEIIDSVALVVEKYVE